MRVGRKGAALIWERGRGEGQGKGGARLSTARVLLAGPHARRPHLLGGVLLEPSQRDAVRVVLQQEKRRITLDGSALAAAPRAAAGFARAVSRSL
jgi:hypothetical protein